jgi:PAS domain S-box-containing protein
MLPGRNEALYEQIVQNAGDAIIFSDTEGKIQLWNAGAEYLFGFRAEEILGKPMDLIIPENLRQRHWDGYRATMATGQTRYSRDLLAVPALRKDGTRISIEFTIVLVKAPDGAITGAAAILRDVTARWNEQKQLKQRIASLEAEIVRLGGTVPSPAKAS